MVGNGHVQAQAHVLGVVLESGVRMRLTTSTRSIREAGTTSLNPRRSLLTLCGVGVGRRSALTDTRQLPNGWGAAITGRSLEVSPGEANTTAYEQETFLKKLAWGLLDGRGMLSTSAYRCAIDAHPPAAEV